MQLACLLSGEFSDVAFLSWSYDSLVGFSFLLFLPALACYWTSQLMGGHSSIPLPQGPFVISPDIFSLKNVNRQMNNEHNNKKKNGSLVMDLFLKYIVVNISVWRKAMESCLLVFRAHAWPGQLKLT